jgi:hypothetical protein
MEGSSPIRLSPISSFLCLHRDGSEKTWGFAPKRLTV